MNGRTNDNVKHGRPGWNLRGLFGRWLGSPAHEAENRTHYVKVWDAQRDAYRQVNLYDRNDPMWDAAWSIARNEYRDTRSDGPRRSAA